MNKIEVLERRKEKLILTYLSLQDRADLLNERIYRVCCEVEITNQKISQARAEKAAREAHEKAKVQGGGEKVAQPSVSSSTSNGDVERAAS